MAKKGSKKPTKGYEVAQIYPLNLTKVQVEALIGHPILEEINTIFIYAWLKLVIQSTSAPRKNYKFEAK